MSKIATWVGLLGLFTVSAHAMERAENIACSDPEWVGEPRMEDGRFKGELASDCVLADTVGGGLTSLRAAFLDGVAHSTEVHAGPTPTTWQGLPSEQFDVTTVTPTGEGDKTISVRAWVDVAELVGSRVVYASRSQKIKAEGNSGLLRQINVTLDTRADASDVHRFSVRLTNYLEIKCPWYAPEEMFFGKAKEATLQQYLDRRTQMLPQVWRYL
jgi:hypothetical protein